VDATGLLLLTVAVSGSEWQDNWVAAYVEGSGGGLVLLIIPGFVLGADENWQ
jgi:hypothetical protein